MSPVEVNLNEMRERAARFVHEWRGETYERGESQSFWNEWFEIFGIRRRSVATFEKYVSRLSGDRGFIDLYWPGHLVVEQKSANKDLIRAAGQAFDYLEGLSQAEMPRMVISSDFATFHVHDLDTGDVIDFALTDLPQRVEAFAWLAGHEHRHFEHEDAVNIKAADLMGRLYDLLDASGYGGHPLRVLLVRLLFVLFADDTGIWEHGLFSDYLENRTAPDGSDVGMHLSQIFQVLNTPVERRQSTLDETLARLPYVNGDLFGETVAMPAFDARMRSSLIDACRFDWKAISPAIFGSMFQSVMDADERRNLGAHYTREQNILKVIEPLFLDDLRAEYARAASVKALERLHDKLAALTFFDPACGCGNFLIVTYREIRRLELDIMRGIAKLKGPNYQMTSDINYVRKVKLSQFYGIEVEEFPARIAETAMYLIDHLMNIELEQEFGLWQPEFPIRVSAQIRQGNAIRMDWNDVLPAAKCSFLFGNPPFVGMYHLNPDQQDDNRIAFADIDASGLRTGRLDYVACWYAKAIAYMADTRCRAAFVSTNSLTQGEQARTMGPLLERNHFKIDFAHRTFKWSSEAHGTAQVHVVVIGFSVQNTPTQKTIFDYPSPTADPTAMAVDDINFFLEGHATTPAKRYEPLVAGLTNCSKGSQPTDGGHLIVEAAEYASVMADPIAAKYVRPFCGAKEMLHDLDRWCLWLRDATPSDLRSSPVLAARLAQVAQFRRTSKTESVRDQARTPALFTQIRQPDSTYFALPQTSSSARDYIPGRYFNAETIAGNALYVFQDVPLWLFAYLQSAVFMTWVRAFSGRMKSDFQIAPSTVYFTFPFLAPAGLALSRIEAAAQEVLDVRETHVGQTLADLYDPLAMPADLRKAHDALDAEIDAMYGLKRPTPAERLARLLREYEKLARPLEAQMTGRRRR